MIKVVISAHQAEGPPVVTTAETIDERRLTAILGPVVARMMDAVEKISGVYPVQAELILTWEDGSVKEKKDDPSPKFDVPSNIPKWMS